MGDNLKKDLGTSEERKPLCALPLRCLVLLCVAQAVVHWFTTLPLGRRGDALNVTSGRRINKMKWVHFRWRRLRWPADPSLGTFFLIGFFVDMSKTPKLQQGRQSVHRKMVVQDGSKLAARQFLCLYDYYYYYCKYTPCYCTYKLDN